MEDGDDLYRNANHSNRFFDYSRQFLETKIVKILTIEAGDSKLPLFISAAAAKMKPKPEAISTMTIDLERFNVPAFKKDIFHLAPDTIILDPPHWEPNLIKWGALLAETLRHVDISNGRLILVSSVDVLGDAQLRTEGAVETPFSDRGVFLQSSEALIESSTSRHYIMWFPYTTESTFARAWTSEIKPVIGNNNEIFTLINLEDMADSILGQAETGWFGKFHITPNDFLTLYDLIKMQWSQTKRIPDHSLASKYNWKVAKSKDVWDKLVKEMKVCEAFKTSV